MTKKDIALVLEKSKVVAVVRKIPQEVVHDVISALVAGGITTVEITLDSPGAEKSIADLRTAYDGRVTIGAGTVLSTVQLDNAVQAGAEFLVCPHFDVRLIDRARKHGVPIIPGVLTPTEIRTAVRTGANAVKIFPAGAMGPGYIKDLLGPFGDLKMMVTGGISEQNASQYIQAGAIAVGMGSALFPRTDIEERNWGSISNRAKRAISSIS